MASKRKRKLTDRDAKCIDVLQAQIKAAYPGRDTDSDGTIAGAAHHLANPTSDHEADSRGIVHAVDFTHDPSVGFDSYKWADYMAGLALDAPKPDPRIKYIISNSRIWNPSINATKWRPYNGANPHDQHVHVSVNRTGEDDTRPWDIGPVPVKSAPAVKQPSAGRLQMAKTVIDFEARRDSNGHLTVYHLPANDGGGRYEVAGINEKYDGPMVRKLVALLEARQFDEAETAACEYIASNTDAAASWTTRPAVECYLRDCIFNRGAKGAARILQRAIGVRDDGIVGPRTMAAEVAIAPDKLLLKLRAAREDYERNVVGYRANFWKGLTNRWDNALKVAQTFL